MVLLTTEFDEDDDDDDVDENDDDDDGLNTFTRKYPLNTDMFKDFLCAIFSGIRQYNQLNDSILTETLSFKLRIMLTYMYNLIIKIKRRSAFKSMTEISASDNTVKPN